MSANAPHDPSPPAARQTGRQHPSFAHFRAWRESTIPRAAYQVAPAFWTPAGLEHRATFDAIDWPSIKRWQPQITGLAYTARRLYLVVVTGSASYEHVARLIHCRALMRDDPDYAQHRSKRLSTILLCDEAPPAIADFARRHRVQVLARGAVPTHKAAIAPAPEPADAFSNRD